MSHTGRYTDSRDDRSRDSHDKLENVFPALSPAPVVLFIYPYTPCDCQNRDKLYESKHESSNQENTSAPTLVYYNISLQILNVPSFLYYCLYAIKLQKLEHINKERRGYYPV